MLLVNQLIFIVLILLSQTIEAKKVKQRNFVLNELLNFTFKEYYKKEYYKAVHTLKVSLSGWERAVMGVFLEDYCVYDTFMLV